MLISPYGSAFVALAQVELYEFCSVAGVVHRLRIDPTNGRIEAMVDDGTGVVTASWSLRQPTPQLDIVPGERIILHGTCGLDPSGAVVMNEPLFDTIPASAVARRP